jgi:hypothetical protein
MKPPPLGGIVVVIATAAAIAFVLCRFPTDPMSRSATAPPAAAPQVLGGASSSPPEVPRAAITGSPFVDPEPASRATVDEPAAAAASREVEAFAQGVIGRIGGERAGAPSSSDEPAGGPRMSGLAPHRAEAFVLPVRIGPTTTFYERPEVRRRLGSDGAFRLPTAPGLKLVVVRQDDAVPGRTDLWTAVVRVAPGVVADLGVGEFSHAVSAGRVVDEAGIPVAGAMVFCDERDAAPRPLESLGFEAMRYSDANGAFSFSVARYAGPASAFPRPPVWRVRFSAVDAERRAEPQEIPIGGRCDLVLAPRGGAVAPPVVRRLSIAAPDDTRLWIRSEELVFAHRLLADARGSDGRFSFSCGLPAGRYEAEFTADDRTAVVTLDFGRDDEVRLDPEFAPGREVEGVAVGRVARVLFADEPRERELQALDAEGAFRLVGLPAHGALTLRAAGRTILVPANSPRVVRLD